LERVASAAGAAFVRGILLYDNEHWTGKSAAECLAWTVNMSSNIEQGRRNITVAEFIFLAQQMDVDTEVMFRRVLRW
jgi:plasmid maintenance system antidote protein VapI